MQVGRQSWGYLLLLLLSHCCPTHIQALPGSHKKRLHFSFFLLLLSLSPLKTKSTFFFFIWWWWWSFLFNVHPKEEHQTLKIHHTGNQRPCMLRNIPVDARSHQFIPKAWLFNAWEGKGRKEEARSWLYERKRSHSSDISPELHLEEEKKLRKKTKPHHPSLGCCTVIYKLNSEKRGQNSMFFFPQISALAQQRNAFGLQEHSSHHQEDKPLPLPPDSLAERRHVGFNCIQRCHSRDTRVIRAFVCL